MLWNFGSAPTIHPLRPKDYLRTKLHH